VVLIFTWIPATLNFFVVFLSTSRKFHDDTELGLSLSLTDLLQLICLQSS
jgi:hypothetical protein